VREVDRQHARAAVAVALSASCAEQPGVPTRGRSAERAQAPTSAGASSPARQVAAGAAVPPDWRSSARRGQALFSSLVSADQEEQVAALGKESGEGALIPFVAPRKRRSWSVPMDGSPSLTDCALRSFDRVHCSRTPNSTGPSPRRRPKKESWRGRRAHPR
jgi:hypothetical protein